jgi:hypothetical protein
MNFRFRGWLEKIFGTGSADEQLIKYSVVQVCHPSQVTLLEGCCLGKWKHCYSNSKNYRSIRLTKKRGTLRVLYKNLNRLAINYPLPAFSFGALVYSIFTCSIISAAPSSFPF